MEKNERKSTTITLDDLIETAMRGVDRAQEARRVADGQGVDLDHIIRFPPLVVGFWFNPFDGGDDQGAWIEKQS